MWEQLSVTGKLILCQISRGHKTPIFVCAQLIKQEFTSGLKKYARIFLYMFISRPMLSSTKISLNILAALCFLFKFPQ